MIIENLFRTTDGKVFTSYKEAWLHEFEMPYVMVRMYNREGSYVYDPEEAVSFMVMGSWAADFVSEYLRHEHNFNIYPWGDRGNKDRPDFSKWVWIVAKDYDNPGIYGPSYHYYNKESSEAKYLMYQGKYSKVSPLYKIMME